MIATLKLRFVFYYIVTASKKNKALHKTFFSSFFRIIKGACNIDDGGKINFPFKRTALRDMHADN